MQTEEKILTNAYDLFKRYGVRSVTMDEIAGHCGVSKKTVYQFFEDKDTLVECIITDIISKAQEYCSAQSRKSDNAIHEMFLAMEIAEQLVEGANPAVINDLRKYHSTAFSKIEEHKQQFMMSFIRKNLERGIAEGLYREDINLDIIAPFYLHSLSVAVEQDIFPKLKYATVYIDATISMFLLYGLASTKGIRLIEKYKQQRKLNTA